LCLIKHTGYIISTHDSEQAELKRGESCVFGYNAM
jgi:hypothetical protein